MTQARPPVISRTELATALGLEDIRTGRHHLRTSPQHGEIIGSSWVSYYWILEVIPSFDPNCILCVFAETGEERTKKDARGCLKAAFAGSKRTHVIELREDPVARALQDIDLLSNRGGLSLDGVGYSLEFATAAMRGTIDF